MTCFQFFLCQCIFTNAHEWCVPLNNDVQGMNMEKKEVPFSVHLLLWIGIRKFTVRCKYFIKLLLKYISHWRWNYNEFVYVDSRNHGLIAKEQNSVEWKEIWLRVEVGSYMHFIKQLWWNPDLISLPDKQKNSYELQGVHDFILSSNLEENRTNQFLGNSSEVLFSEIHYRKHYTE